MNDHDTHDPVGISRRDALKLSGLTLGGVACAGGLLDLVARAAQAADTCADDCSCADGPSCRWDVTAMAQRYSYFDQLPPFQPFSRKTTSTIQRLGADEMRITFMGSAIPPRTLAQRMMSIFVEVGWDESTQMPLDQFVFDCGSGVCANYGAMNVGFGRMDKIFLTHLHGDHMSDLVHIYCFGPSADRKSPQFVWGPGPSGVRNPNYDPANPTQNPEFYDDGTRTFCAHLREACRWHSESFSFQTTSYKAYVAPTQADWGLPHEPKPVGTDSADDAYAMIPIELDWTLPAEQRIAYQNDATGVKISYFPVIHDRQGSIGYKLEWNGLSMIFTGDTKPETNCLEAARNGGKGVDVFIHEMIVPAEIWAMKSLRLTDPDDVPESAVQQMTMVQNSSHSPQGAFGYMLSQIDPRPRLTVATHFPTADDTVACAMRSLQQHCRVFRGNYISHDPHEARVTWSFDRMVITVSKKMIFEQRAVVEEFGFTPTYQAPPGTAGNPDGFDTPKYHYEGQTGGSAGDPYAQIDTATAICPCGGEGECNFRTDGY